MTSKKNKMNELVVTYNNVEDVLKFKPFHKTEKNGFLIQDLQANETRPGSTYVFSKYVQDIIKLTRKFLV